MPGARKHEMITFKADESLSEALRHVPNRSEFIRAAILAALDHVCPLCQGTGMMTPDQRRHWEAFSGHHTIEECKECNAVHLVCREGECSCAH